MLLKSGKNYCGAAVKCKSIPIKMHSDSAYLVFQKAKLKMTKYLYPPAQLLARAN